MVWEGYILGKIRIYLCNVVIREPKIPTDDQMVLGELIGEGVRRHCRYCNDWYTWTITEANGGTVQEGY